MTAPPLPDSLLAGYQRFRAGRYPLEAERYRRLSIEGQSPRTMVVACSDSRSAPEAMFDAGPGELFVVRNVAAIVPVYEPDTRSHAASAALEYAVRVLAVSTILVLGHGQCGGVAAAIDDTAALAATDFIGTWVGGLRELASLLEAGDSSHPERRRTRLEHLAVERSRDNLLTFPWVRSRAEAGALSLRGAWFDIALGELHALGAAGWEKVAVGGPCAQA
jgi:carbonic anhydrase